MDTSITNAINNINTKWNEAQPISSSVYSSEITKITTITNNNEANIQKLLADVSTITPKLNTVESLANQLSLDTSAINNSLSSFVDTYQTSDKPSYENAITNCDSSISELKNKNEGYDAELTRMNGILDDVYSKTSSMQTFGNSLDWDRKNLQCVVLNLLGRYLFPDKFADILTLWTRIDNDETTYTDWGDMSGVPLFD